MKLNEGVNSEVNLNNYHVNVQNYWYSQLNIDTVYAAHK